MTCHVPLTLVIRSLGTGFPMAFLLHHVESLSDDSLVAERGSAGCASEEKAWAGNDSSPYEKWWPQRDSNPCRGPGGFGGRTAPRLEKPAVSAPQEPCPNH